MQQEAYSSRVIGNWALVFCTYSVHNQELLHFLPLVSPWSSNNVCVRTLETPTSCCFPPPPSLAKSAFRCYQCLFSESANGRCLLCRLNARKNRLRICRVYFTLQESIAAGTVTSWGEGDTEMKLLFPFRIAICFSYGTLNFCSASQFNYSTFNTNMTWFKQLL